jgi:cell division protease FtsH
MIDEEVRRLVEAGESKARKVLTTYRKDLDLIAEALLEYETLTGKDVDALLKGEEIVRKEPDTVSATVEEEVSDEAVDTGADPKDHELDGDGSEQKG